MLLVDNKTTDHSKTSYFLLREEFKELYPTKVNGRMNYIFRHKQPTNVIDGEAKLLMKKFPHLTRWRKHEEAPETNRHAELEKMKYQALKTLGAKAGLNFKELGCKRDILIDRIVDKEKEK